MPKNEGFPAWLVRRSYFKRIGRWTKPGGSGRPSQAQEPIPVDRPSNVLPFPVRPAAIVRADLPGTGSARG